MEFKIVVPQSQAEEEITAVLNRKKILPKRREQLEAAINALVEGMMLGFLSIDSEGKFIQTLIEPVAGITTLEYKPRLDPLVINKEVAAMKNDSQTNRIVLYGMQLTGQLSTTIQKLEPGDRNILDAICLLFF